MFLIQQGNSEIPLNWHMKMFSHFQLLHLESFPVHKLTNTDNAPIGWLLGYPIDLAKKEMISNAYCLSVNDGSSQQEIEKELYQLGGRFIALLSVYGSDRIYLDSAGSLSLVYDSDANLIAAMPNVIKKHTNNSYKPIEESQGDWYPAGLTPYYGIRRLLPNHYLDLSAWNAVRHWPNQPLSTTVSTEKAVDNIIVTSRKILTSVAKQYPLTLSLTAGQDTRTLLALAKPFIDKTSFFTFSSSGMSADKQIAKVFAKKFLLLHSFYKIQTSSEHDLKSWNDMLGGCVGGDIARIYTTLEKMDSNSALLPGMCGEVARAYYWRKGDEKKSFTAELLLKRAGLPVTRVYKEAMHNWLSGLVDYPTKDILDLFYIEQRLGCWAGPQQYGTDPFCAVQLFVLGQRAIFENMLQLDHSYRCKQMLAVDICQKLWPELLHFPFNRHVGMQKWMAKLTRRMKRMITRLNSFWLYMHSRVLI